MVKLYNNAAVIFTTSIVIFGNGIFHWPVKRINHLITGIEITSAIFFFFGSLFIIIYMWVWVCTFMCIYLFSCPSVPAPQLLILHHEYLVWCIVVYQSYSPWVPDLVNKPLFDFISFHRLYVWCAIPLDIV